MSSPNGEQIETREFLKPHLNQRIIIEGRVQKYDSYYDKRVGKKVPSVCLIDVDRIVQNGKKEQRQALTTHVFIGYCGALQEMEAEPGDLIRCECSVYKYPDEDPNDHNKTITKYGLKEPRDIEIVNKLETKPVPTIARLTSTPAPRPEEIIPMTKPDEKPTPRPEQKPADQKPADKHECLKAVLALVERFGIVKVEKAVQAAKMIDDE